VFSVNTLGLFVPEGTKKKREEKERKGKEREEEGEERAREARRREIRVKTTQDDFSKQMVP
jgi:hypothetical protein